MVFFGMAVRNVVRNWNRTGMIILSMAVASALATLTMALSGGFAVGSALPWRQMVGADILVYPDRLVFSGPGTTDGSWEWRLLSRDLKIDALLFHPELAEGYLSPRDAPSPVFDVSALPEVPAGDRDIASIEPARLLAAYAVLEDGRGGQTRVGVTLRGRSRGIDLHLGVPETISSGRYFPGGESVEWMALVNGASSTALSGTGKRLRLDVPLIRGFGPDGAPIVDHTSMKTFYFLVYGRYILSLGTVRLQGYEPVEVTGPPPRCPVAIDEPEVWVPATTFDAVYREVAGQPMRYTAQLCVTVTDTSRSKTAAARLAEMLPGRTVLTVPQEVALSGLRYEAVVTSQDPLSFEISRVYYSKPCLSLDVKGELAAMAFLVAGLLVVANMYILVTQRRREIGVLKALGAGSRDVFSLFLVEALGYSFVGSAIGFGAIRLVTLLGMFASRASLIEGALLTLRTAGIVIGVTTAVALVFGFLPAWEAARTPSATLLGEQ